jgi:hypothetical protein
MASGGNVGLSGSSAARNRGTSTTSPLVSQPSSVNNPMAGCPTRWPSVWAWGMAFKKNKVQTA